jgi:hypothetical protein
VPRQIEGQAAEALAEGAGQDRIPGAGRGRVAVHENDRAAIATALRERDLLTAHGDVLLVHPLSFRSARSQVLTNRCPRR